MEVTEVATRMLRRYWPVLLAAVMIPPLAMAAYVLRQPATYTAHARIVAADSIPRSAAEATGIASQVQAIATGRDLVVKALTQAGVRRDPDRVVTATSVTGLGSSTLVDLAYTDRDAGAAQRVTAALAVATAAQLDEVRIGGLPQALRDLDNQLTDLAAKRAPLAAAAQANPKDAVAANRLAGIDRLISDLSGERNQLAETAASTGHSTVVAAPVRPRADSRSLPARLAIAGILGLVLGLLFVGLHEMLRPSVSTAEHVARLLEVPMLGVLAPDPVALASIGRRVRLAAARARVTTVVLGRTTREPLPPELVDRVEAATLRPPAGRTRVAIPVDVDGRPSLGAVLAGERVRPESAGGSAAVGVAGIAVRAPVQSSAAAPVRLRRVSALEELDPAAESERIGLVVLTAPNTRLSAVGDVRDLMAASGWPLLGVLGHPGGGRR